MATIRIISVPGFGVFRLHFRSAIAGRVAGSQGAFTPNATDIYIAGDSSSAFGLAHEVGHTRQAKKYGWRYLLWVFYHYAKSGYAASLPERDASQFAWDNYPAFFPVWADG